MTNHTRTYFIHIVLDVSLIALRAYQEGLFHGKVMHYRKLIENPYFTCLLSSWSAGTTDPIEDHLGTSHKASFAWLSTRTQSWLPTEKTLAMRRISTGSDLAKGCSCSETPYSRCLSSTFGWDSGAGYLTIDIRGKFRVSLEKLVQARQTTKSLDF